MILSDVRTDCRSHLDEDAARFWDDDELDRWIHEAMRDIARRAEILPDVAKIPVVADKQEYNLPRDVLRIHRVEFRQTSTNTWALEYRSLMEMDNLWVQSRSSTGQPAWYTIWGHAGGSNQLRLYPVPSETNSDGLWVYYYRLPSKPVNPGDQIDLPNGWEDLIPLYVEHIARRKDNDGRWKEAYELYENRLSQMMRVTRHGTDQVTFFAADQPYSDWVDW